LPHIKQFKVTKLFERKRDLYLRFEVFVAVTMKNGVFWDVTPLCFRSFRRLLVTANVVPSSPILVTLKMEAISSYETLVLTRATRRNIPEDDILHRFEFVDNTTFTHCG
jgi:hypothetical protein